MKTENKQKNERINILTGIGLHVDGEIPVESMEVT
jgi:hypothetical protein